MIKPRLERPIHSPAECANSCLPVTRHGGSSDGDDSLVVGCQGGLLIAWKGHPLVLNALAYELNRLVGNSGNDEILPSRVFELSRTECGSGPRALVGVLCDGTCDS